MTLRPTPSLYPAFEEERVRALGELQIAGTPPEELFDDLAALCALVFDAPISLISLVTREAVWFKAQAGLPGVAWMPRQDSLCSAVVRNGYTTVFEDLQATPCQLVNPAVALQLGLQFYAGAPLLTRQGHAIGALCVLDRHPRTFSDEQQTVLDQLAQVVMRTIELRLVAMYHPGGPPVILTETFRYLDVAVDRLAALLPPPAGHQPPHLGPLHTLLVEVEATLAHAHCTLTQPAEARTAAAVEHLLAAREV